MVLKLAAFKLFQTDEHLSIVLFIFNKSLNHIC